MSPADKPPPLTADAQPPPEKFKKPLQFCLLAQVIFNLLMCVALVIVAGGAGAAEIGICCGPFWILPGLYAGLLYAELIKPRELRMINLRPFGFIIFPVQFLFYGFVFYVSAMEKYPDLFSQIVMWTALCGCVLGLESVITLFRYNRHNPHRWVTAPPKPPPPEPEDIETTGDWDEAADRSPPKR